METIWSKEDITDAEKREVFIVYENLIDPNLMDQKELPTDIPIVTYVINGETRIDACRAFKMVDIFDIYYDKLRTNGSVVCITSGYGMLKPKFWKGDIPALKAV